MTEFEVSFKIDGAYCIARPGQDGVELSADEAEALFEFVGRSIGVMMRYDYMLRILCSFVRAFINHQREPEYFNAPDAEAAEAACLKANACAPSAAPGAITGGRQGEQIRALAC